MSADWRHSRGVRSSVQHDDRDRRAGRARALNHHELKTWKSLGALEEVDDARAEDRVVAGVDVGHRARRSRPASGTANAGQLADRHPDDAP